MKVSSEDVNQSQLLIPLLDNIRFFCRFLKLFAGADVVFSDIEGP